jgi:hypothetical protein
VAKTARQLIRELSSRLQEYVLVTPQSGGSTVLHAPELLMFFPQQIQQFNGWVYCASAVDALNQGLERRGQQWTTDGTLSLYPPGFRADHGRRVRDPHALPRARSVKRSTRPSASLG